MISVPDYEILRAYKRDRAVTAWSFAVAVPLTLLIWILLTTNLFSHRLTGIGEQKPEQMVVMNSSEIQIRPPAPFSVPKEHKPPPPTAPKPQPQRAQQQAVVPRPQAQPTEIANIVQHAPPQPRSVPQPNRQAALAEQLAQQEVAFAREAQQINNSRSPTDVATADPNLHAQMNNAFHPEFAGSRILQGKGDGFLVPFRYWRYEGENCYQGKYYWTYPTGGQESGTIPWNFCYPPGIDPIAHGVREFPFPLPFDNNFRISEAQLQPIEKDVYDDWLAHQ